MMFTRRQFFRGVAATVVVAAFPLLPATARAWKSVRKLQAEAWKSLVVRHVTKTLPWADEVKAEFFDFNYQIGVLAGAGGRRHAVRAHTKRNLTTTNAREAAHEIAMALTRWFAA